MGTLHRPAYLTLYPVKVEEQRQKKKADPNPKYDIKSHDSCNWGDHLRAQITQNTNKRKTKINKTEKLLVSCSRKVEGHP